MELDIIGGDEIVGLVIWCWYRQWDGVIRVSCWLGTWRRRLTDIVSLVPTGSLVATAKAVYVGPRLLIREGDFVRGKADDLPILLMELSLALDELTGQEAVDERQSRRSPKLGTRKIGERVK
jgi:hypothetical protein